MKDGSTKRRRPGEPVMRAGHEFRGGVRGKYAKAYASGTNVVLLAPDDARVFRTTRAVNAALRSVIRRRRAPRAR